MVIDPSVEGERTWMTMRSSDPEAEELIKARSYIPLFLMAPIGLLPILLRDI